MGFFDSESPAVSFLRVGDSITGIIDAPYTVRQATEFGTSKLKVYANGEPWMMACIPLRTNLRDPSNAQDDGLRTLYVDKVSMREAIQIAFKAVGAKDVEPGGTLTVQYTGDQPSDKGNPSKLFAAHYVPPVGLLGQDAGASTQAAAQHVSSAPQYPAAGGGYPTTGGGYPQAQPGYAPQQSAVGQIPSGPNLMPPAASQVPQQAAPAAPSPTNGAPAFDPIATIRALAQGGMTPAQISANVPAFTAEAVQAVLSLPA